MNSNEIFKASGYVKITGVFKNRTEILWEGPNVLTQGFAVNISRLFGGSPGNMIGVDARTVEAGTALWGSFMKVGRGSNPAQFGDTTLDSPFQDDASNDIIVPVSSVSYGVPLLGSTVFNAILPAGTSTDDFNNEPLQEVGLFSESGVLMARHVHPLISKTALFQLQYAWTISFRS